MSRLLLKERQAVDSLFHQTQQRPLKQWIVTCNNRLRDASQEYYLNMRSTVPELSQDPGALSTEKPRFFTFEEVVQLVDGWQSKPFFKAASKDSLSDPGMEFISWNDTALDSSSPSLQVQDMAGLYDRSKMVTFKMFSKVCYPHLPQKLTRKFSAAIVWTEIQSYIKGCMEVLHTENGHLTREEYTRLAEKRVSIFTHQERLSIYELWRLYESWKNRQWLWDM
jgi:hypothetical protein